VIGQKLITDVRWKTIVRMKPTKRSFVVGLCLSGTGNPYPDRFWCGFDNSPVGDVHTLAIKAYVNFRIHSVDPSRNWIAAKGLSEPTAITDDEGYTATNLVVVFGWDKTHSKLDGR